jgi:conjugative transfer signal peptidase TraF
MTPRLAIVIATLAGCALVVGPAITSYGPRLIWNASASVPVGLYRTEPVGRIEVTDLVAVLPPEPLATFLAERGYLARNVPIIKRVLAIAGTRVCRRGAMIIAYDHAYGEARARDSSDRRLPSWQGCRQLRDGEVFLMNWDAPDSFDGRYFGPLPTSAIIARVIPIWTDEAGAGRFRWRAADTVAAP